MQLVAYNTTGALFATQLVVVVEWHDRKVGYLLNYLNQEISTFLTFSTTVTFDRSGVDGYSGRCPVPRRVRGARGDRGLSLQAPQDHFWSQNYAFASGAYWGPNARLRSHAP